MIRYHIGLDFGTYQTKACIYNIDNDVHEFFRFPATGTFFIPSRVGQKSDGTFHYGNGSADTDVRQYYYFKIASAEDEEFLTETFDIVNRSRSVNYKTDEFQPFTPEFLSVAYITYVLFTIKEYYRSQHATKPSGSKFLNRFSQSSSTGQEVKFTTQIGIPTEWSQQKNLRRKRKFENILMISELLLLKFKTLDAYQKATTDELINEVRDIYKNNQYESTEQFYAALNTLGLSVFPETAAGLTFIIKTRQLNKGYYAIMDIGGGSTDISFFSVESGNNIRYLASESYILAANNVYKYLAEDEQSVSDLHKAEKYVHSLIENGLWENNKTITKALVEVRNSLNKLVYQLFHKRMWCYNRGSAKDYNEQPIILYGGGARLPALGTGTVLIHDNGVPNWIGIPCSYMLKQPIDRYTSIINVLPDDGSWKPDLPVLVVALGLSYIKPDSFADWFGEDTYHSRDSDPRDGEFIGLNNRPVKLKPGPDKWAGGSGQQVPHPFNEDYYIYDVLASKWNH